MSDLLRKLNDIFDRGTKQKLILATLFTVVIAVLDTAAIALVLPLVDLAANAESESGSVDIILSILDNYDIQTVTLILTATVVILFVLKDIGTMAFTWWLTGFTLTQRVNLSSHLLRHFLTAPYTEVSRRSSSELLRTMHDSVAQVFGYTVSSLMSATTNAISIVAIFIALAIAAPLPTLAVVCYFGLAGLVFATIVKPRALAAGTALSEASVASWRTAFAALGGIKELNIRGTQEHFVQSYREAATQAARANRMATYLNGLPRQVLEILFILGIGLVLAVSMAASATPTSGTSLGMLALFVAAGFRILPAITGLLGASSNIKVGARALDIVHKEVVAARATSPHSSRDGSRLPFNQALRAESISFRYPDGTHDVVQNIDLEIARGTSVALVGGSGAGKTTLVDLVLGLHMPRHGRITVDGIDIADHRRSWQNNIGYVAQDIYILEATLAENIAFDQERQNIDERLLTQVIRYAQLDTLVLELPQGVDTPLGEKGARLSGGQKQRVGIARALYRNPSLLVLDEATSALDNETEHRISATIAGLRGEFTVLIVAHRLSTVRHADQVVFMKGGRIRTVGSFDEVRANDEEFARMVRLGSLEPDSVHAATTVTPEMRD